MSQPDDILKDSERALRAWDDMARVPDRFGDDVDHIEFWVNLTKIMRRELVKATRDPA